MPTITSTKPCERDPSSVSLTTEAALRWRVLIVDAHTSIREMIRVILDGYSDLIEVAGEASNAEGAVDLANSKAVDLVLIDAHLANGADAIRKIKKVLPHVVIMGMSSEYAPYVHNAMSAAGAVGFVRMEDATDLLFKSIVFAMCAYGPMRMYVHHPQASGRPNASFV